MEFGDPTQFMVEKLEIDEIDVRNLFISIDIYENIFSGGVTGNIALYETDAVKFIEDNDIQFIEPISLQFTNANDETFMFEGVINGYQDNTTIGQKRVYILDFVSKTVRKNEMVFVTKPFSNEKPEDIAQQMSDALESEQVDIKGEGEPLTFLPPNMKPLDVMRYVIDHGITQKATVSNSTDRQQEASGTTGFCFWETLDGFRFCPVDDLLEGAYEEWEDYENTLANRSHSMDRLMKNIMTFEFPSLGNFQQKLRSGSIASKQYSFDMDTGEFSAIEYKADETVASEKQSKEVTGYTRILHKLYSPELHQPTCEKAQPNVWDQSRRCTQQTLARQNSFCDQHGRIVLPPQFNMRAGDTINIKINKVTPDDAPGKYDEKSSGKYVIKQVGHHFNMNGKSYTKLAIMRSLTQQNESSTI
jgi:hypothetical protein